MAAGTLLIYDLFVQTPINLPDFLDNSIRITIIVGFWLTILVLISRSKHTITKHLGDQLTTIIQVLIASIAVLVMVFAILNVLGVSPQSLLTGAGIASITIGLIVSTFVGSILSGALVFASHKFRVGDEIIFNNIPGRIVELTAIATRVKTDIGTVAIPNSSIASGAVIITKIESLQTISHSRPPYSKGDRIVTTYMQGEGTVVELTALYTQIVLDSGIELTFLNSSVLSGSIAIAKTNNSSLNHE